MNIKVHDKSLETNTEPCADRFTNASAAYTLLTVLFAMSAGFAVGAVESSDAASTDAVAVAPLLAAAATAVMAFACRRNGRALTDAARQREPF